MKKLMILGLLCSLFLIPGRSFALSCIEPPPPEVSFAEYDAVLIGSVEKIESNNARKTLTVQVERSFKGVNEERITVHEDVMWGESQENATYLFFLNKEGDKWIHPLCAPTTHNTNVADEAFANKEEITLQDVDSISATTNTTFIVLVAAVLFAMTAAVYMMSLARKRRKT